MMRLGNGNKIIKKKGENKMHEQINAQRSAFPTIVDKMPA